MPKINVMPRCRPTIIENDCDGHIEISQTVAPGEVQMIKIPVSMIDIFVERCLDAARYEVE